MVMGEGEGGRVRAKVRDLRGRSQQREISFREISFREISAEGDLIGGSVRLAIEVEASSERICDCGPQVAPCMPACLHACMPACSQRNGSHRPQG